MEVEAVVVDSRTTMVTAPTASNRIHTDKERNLSLRDKQLLLLAEKTHMPPVSTPINQA